MSYQISTYETPVQNIKPNPTETSHGIFLPQVQGQNYGLAANIKGDFYVAPFLCMYATI